VDRGTPEATVYTSEKNKDSDLVHTYFGKSPRTNRNQRTFLSGTKTGVRVPTVLIDSVHPDPQLSRRDRSSMPLLPKAAVLLLQTAAVFAGPAYAPFTSFGNFTRRTDLCADAARVARGEVPAETQNNALNS